MDEQQTLKANVMTDPNVLAFLVYADYLDENNQDSSMWRTPYSPIIRMTINGGGGSGGSNDIFGGSFGGGWSGDNRSGYTGNSKNGGGEAFGEQGGGGHGGGSELLL